MHIYHYFFILVSRIAYYVGLFNKTPDKISAVYNFVSGALLQFFRDLVARATITCHASVFVVRAKMTQVTSRNNKTHFSTWKALNLFGICSDDKRVW